MFCPPASVRAFVLAVAFLLAFTGIAFATNVSGTISTNTNWTTAGSPYNVTGNITVSGGATLTIDPGVEVRFNGNYFIAIGATSGGSPTGKLIANGTSGSHIVFKANSGTSAGTWQNIVFNSSAISGCSMQYCDVMHGGSVAANGMIYCTGASPSFSDIALSVTNNPGIYLAGTCAPAFSGGLSLATSSSYLLKASATTTIPTFSSVSLTSAGKLGYGPADMWANLFNSTPTINGSGHVPEVMASTLTMSSTWANLTGLAATRLLGTVTISGSANPVLTLSPGTVIRIDPAFQLLVGGTTSTTQGGLSAVGTSGSHIRFEKGGATQWKSVYFQSFAIDASSSLAYCEFDNGGSTTASVVCDNASPSISNVIFTASQNDCIALLNTSNPAFSGALTQSTGSNYLVNSTPVASQPTFSSVTITNSGKMAKGGAGFWANFFGSNPTISSSGQIAEVVTDTLATSSTWGGLTNLASINFLGTLTVSGSGGPVLSIRPGSTLNFAPAISLTIGGASSTQLGALCAVGTAAQPITFQKSGATAWGTVTFNDYSIDSLCKMDRCTLTDGGSANAVVYVNSASPVLCNLTFTNVGTDAIKIAAGNPVFKGALSFSGTGSGYLIDATATSVVPVFQGVTLSSAAKLGIGAPDFWANLFFSVPTVTGGPYQAEVYTGTLTKSATWGVTNLTTIVLSGALTISGTAAPVMTINPGVHVKLPANASITVGSTNAGSLRALGTSSQHVVFERSAAGSWSAINFADTSDDNRCLLQYCDVLDAGAAANGAVLCSTSSPTLDHLTVQNSASNGVYFDGEPVMSNITVTSFGSTHFGIRGVGTDPMQLTGTNVITGPGAGGLYLTTMDGQVSGVSISNVTGYGIQATQIGGGTLGMSGITFGSSVAKLAVGGADFWAALLAASPTITGSGYVQEVLASTTLSRSTTWGAHPKISSIHLLGHLTIGGSASPILTLAAGAQVYLESGASFTIGISSPSVLPGGLIAAGTSSQHVILDRFGASNWGVLSFTQSTLDAASSLQYCEVRHSGSAANGAVYVASTSPSFSHVTISDSSFLGMKLSGSSSVLDCVTVDNFGTSYAGILFLNSPDAVMTGTNVISGPGLDGVSCSNCAPTLGGISFDNLTGYAINMSATLLTPSMSGLSFASTVAKLAIGGPDFWANFCNSSPTVSGTGYVQEVMSGGFLTKTTTWGAIPGISYILLDNSLYLGSENGPVLTLAPGTVMKITGSICVASNNDSQLRGSLVAAGTSSQHVRFQSAGASPWGMMVIAPYSNDAISKIEYCDFVDGAGGNGWGALTLQGAAPSVHHVTFDCPNGQAMCVQTWEQADIHLHDLTFTDCQIGLRVCGDESSVIVTDSVFQNISGDAVQANVYTALDSSALSLVEDCAFTNVGRGVYGDATSAVCVHNCSFNGWTTAGVDSLQGSYPTIEGCTFTGSAAPVKLPAGSLDLLSHSMLGNTFTITGSPEIGVYGDNMDLPANWAKIGSLYYHVLGSVTFYAPVTIGAGNTLKFDSGKSLTAGGTTHAPLFIEGTAADPVLLTSALSSPSPGAWGAMTMGSDSILEYATIDYAGTSATSAVILDDESVLRHVTIRNSAGNGLRLLANSTNPKPTLLDTCTFTANGVNGVLLDGASKASLVNCLLTSNGAYGLRVSTNSSYVTRAGLRSTTITGNTSGGVHTDAANSTADASFCWWGNAAGPSGSDISGTGAVAYNPWFGASIAAFTTNEPSVEPLSLAPVAGNVHFHGVPNDAASWSLVVKDSGSTTVYTTGGTNAYDVDWNGTSGAPPSALPNGTYSFTMTSTQTASPYTQSIIAGTIALNSATLTASIVSPAALGYAGATASVTVTGTAAGSGFASYVLDYGLGTNPTSYTVIQSSSSAVTSGTLGTFTAPASAQPYLTLRLTVNGSGGATSVDSRQLKLESFGFLADAPNPFTPDGDNFEDTTTAAGVVTWPSNWSVDVYQGATGPLRTWTGTGTRLSVVWDGRNGSGTLLGQATYTLRFNASPVDASTLNVTVDVPVTLGPPDPAIKITSPVDGAVLANNVPVTLALGVPTGAGYQIRLEYGSVLDWTLLAEATTLPSPFTTWNTTLAPGGATKLRATLNLSDGTVHYHEINVTVGNLTAVPGVRVIDPFLSETTSITVASAAPSTGTGTLLVEIYKANTTVDTSQWWEGLYHGYSGSRVWYQSYSLSSGVTSQNVVWNGKTNAGVAVAAGEYVVHATLDYASGFHSDYTEPVDPPVIYRNDYLSNLAVGTTAGPNFDPYYGESIDIHYTLAQAEWVTIAHTGAGSTNCILSKCLQDPGSYTYMWDGRNVDSPGLARGDAASGGLSIPIYVRGNQSPPSLISVNNKSLDVASVLVDPIVIYPTGAQTADVHYALNRNSLVTVKVYDTTSSPSGPLVRTLQASTSQTPGTYVVQFDGKNDAGEYPRVSGTYAVEIVAVDLTDATYTKAARRSVRLMR